MRPRVRSRSRWLAAVAGLAAIVVATCSNAAAVAAAASLASAPAAARAQVPKILEPRGTQGDSGYWLATADGSVFAGGPTSALGGTLTTSSNPVVDIAATRSGVGYWLVEADGNVLPFGAARSFGNLPAINVHVSDIVALAPTGDDGGYWLIGRDGGEFAFGDAKYHGSLPGLGVHVSDIVGMVATADGGGYWLVGADGGVFAFGNATYKGSLPGIGVKVDDIRAMIPSPTREGYILVGADGGTFVFGTGVDFLGSLPGRGITVSDIVGLALTPDAAGYWLAGSDASVYAFGDAGAFDQPAGIGSHLPVVAIAAAPPSTSQLSYADWSVQQTPSVGTGAQLDGVQCHAATDCTAVGFYDSSSGQDPLVEAWNGSSWSQQTAQVPGGSVQAQLKGVSCSGTFCMAVGYYENSSVIDLPLAEELNAGSWSVVNTPTVTGAKLTEFTGISCASTTSCTAVGYYTKAGTTATFAEIWNGSSWTGETTPNPPNAKLAQLQGVSCASSSSCIAVGNYTNSANSEVTLAEQLSAGGWALAPAATPGGALASSLLAVSCLPDSHCAAVGDYTNGAGIQTTLAESWNGSGWVVQATPGVSGALSSVLTGVSCPTGTDCTAVGWYATHGGQELATAEQWNGTSWEAQLAPNPSGASDSFLNGVACAVSIFCTAVGNQTTSGKHLALAEQWVAHIATTTTLSTSAKTAVTGQQVTFTARVSADESSFGTPTGHVTFAVAGKAGSVSCKGGDTVALSGGSAGCTVVSGTLLATDSTYSVKASYAAASSFETSSGSLSPSQVVDKDSTTVTVASSANPSVFSQSPFDFTATVKANSPGAGTPTGTVSFTVDGEGGNCGDGGTTAPLEDGVATCQVYEYFTPGTYSVVATYSGDSNFDGSNNSSSPFKQTINDDGTTTAVSSSANPSVYSQFVDFTATVSPDSPGAGIPQGTVSFTLDGEPICSDSGECTFDLISGSVTSPQVTGQLPGTYPVVATYTPTAGSGFTGSSNSSSPLDQEVDADGTTTDVAASNDPSTYSESDVLTATVAADAPGSGIPQGTVTFTVNGDDVCVPDSKTCSYNLISGTATSSSIAGLVPGTYTVVATYTPTAGSGWTGSSSTDYSLVVNQDGTTTSLSGASEVVAVGATETYTATVDSNPLEGAPFGAVTFTAVNGDSGDSYTLVCTESGSNVVGTADDGTAGESQAVCTTEIDLTGYYTITATYNDTEGDGGWASSDDTYGPVDVHGT
jgi:hypothetical protein